MRKATEPRQYGFTLIELLIVIAIIGLIVSLILVAAADGVRRAEERATQALITKIDTALNDRIDALLNTQPPINQTHRYLAAINYLDPGGSGLYIPTGMSGTVSVVNSDDRRAAVLAQFDYLRSELPDVFFRNDLTSDGAAVASSYPLNFAAAPYPNSLGLGRAFDFVLPLGLFSNGLPYAPGTTTLAIPTSPTPSPSGMFGASFSAAGGIYKQLGYAKTGYDGVDNNGDGLIDDTIEGGIALADLLKNPSSGQPWKLGLHTHKTARAEMLYAVLVEGLGPLGSVFGSDDFTAREVKDTDGDGLLEFVDAWGEPLQFYRWPIYYGTAVGSSDSQLGCNSYGGFGDVRQQDPLDPNQLLVAPGWWSALGNPALTSPAVATFSAPNSPAAGLDPTTVSQGAMAFMNYFHSMVDPNYLSTSTTGSNWDRGAGFGRRAYFSRFLVVSGGPDKEPGVGRFDRDYSDEVSGGSSFPFPSPGLTMGQNAQRLILIENQAGQSDPNPSSRTGSFFEVPSGSATTGFLQANATLDDISNHNLQAVTTGVR